MQQIRLLVLGFKEEVSNSQLVKFRGAIINTIGQEEALLHNHTKDQFIYKYPHVQYKIINHKPVILALEDGIDAINYLFEKEVKNIQIGRTLYHLELEFCRPFFHTFQVWDHTFHYFIRDWWALNTENYNLFHDLKEEKLKIEFLEKKLVGNIISFAKSIDWQIDKPIIVKIHDYEKHWRNYKKNNILAFNLNFETNIHIPQFLGLGKSSSIGFGTIFNLKNNINGK